MKLGINDDWVNYSQVNGRFGDLMTASSWDWSGPIGTQTMTIPATEGWCRPRTYTVSAKGKGTIRIAASDVPQAKQIMKFTGTETYQLGLSITERKLLMASDIDPADPLRDVRITASDAGPGLYHPEFLASLRGFDTIRFMTPQGTAGSQEKTWAGRVTRPGFDVESFVDLCNEEGANGWFCLPARCVTANGAPTDYAREFGALINARLDPRLSAYIEYSNEVWNWGNPYWDESTYTTNQGAAEYAPCGMRLEYARLAHAVQNAVSAEIDPVNGPRIIRVLAGQLAGSWTIAQSLAEAAKHGYKFDAIAGGYYWECLGDVAAIKAAWAAGDRAAAFALIDAGYRKGVDQVMGWHAAIKPMADRAGAKVVAYEGGPGGYQLWGDKDAAPAADAYQDDLLCERTHLDALKAFSDAGVDMFCYFTHCNPVRMFSARRNGGDLTNRRYWALRRYLDGGDPVSWLGGDAKTGGDWIGIYGSLGAMVAGAPTPVPTPTLASAPAVAATAVGLPLPTPPTNVATWPLAPGDTLSPRYPDGSGRSGSAWWDPSEILLDVPDATARNLSLYIRPYGHTHVLAVSILDGGSEAVLDTRSVTLNGSSGVYLRWMVCGHVRISVRCTNDPGDSQGHNALANAVFLDPPSPA